MNETTIDMLFLLIYTVLIAIFKKKIATSVALKIVKAYVSIIALFCLGYYVCSLVQNIVSTKGPRYLLYSIISIYLVSFIWLIIRDLRAYMIGVKNSAMPENLHISICNIIQVIIAFAILNDILFTLEPASFSGISSESVLMNYFDFVYYSFVTFTTLGYGDILPLGIFAKMIVIAEVSIMLCVVTISIIFIEKKVKQVENKERKKDDPPSPAIPRPDHPQH